MITLLTLVVVRAEKLRVAQVAGALVACLRILMFLADKISQDWRASFGNAVLLKATLLFSMHTVAARGIIVTRSPVLVMACTTLMAFPPISGLAGWWMRGEIFPPRKLADAALAMAGVAFVQFGRASFCP